MRSTDPELSLAGSRWEQGMLEELDTPCLVLDLAQLIANIERAQTAARAAGVLLRPHAKTHKSVRIGRMQLDAGASGLTVGTIGEAEVLADGGVDDIFIAYPLWLGTQKARRIEALADRVRLRIGVDSREGCERLAAMLGAGRVDVMVEVESGEERTGIDPLKAADVATAARKAGLRVAGVFTHGGHAYKGPGAAASAADDEHTTLSMAAEELTRVGIECDVVSAGSTPTFALSARAPVTEERPGTYALGDRQQVHLGGCRAEEVAVVVATTVVSRCDPERWIVDAGAKTLSKDLPSWLHGHGTIPSYPFAVIERLYDYHGVVVSPPGTPRPSIGEVITIVPNHICPVVNLTDTYTVLDRGRIVDVWPVDARTRSR